MEHLFQSIRIRNGSEWIEFLKIETDESESMLMQFELPDEVFPLFIVIENEYVDKDWTSLLTGHYCQLLVNHPRRSRRYHIFRDESLETVEDIFTVENDNYYGFFTIYESYPLMRGRTLIRPELFNLDLKTCESEFAIHILGREFKIRCFPSIGQDGRYISCADSCLWSLLRYFSEKYCYYREIYPSEIVEANRLLREGRNVPTRGLSVDQIINIIAEFGLTAAFENEDLIDKAHGYIESGIPLLVGSEKEQHAILGIGLTGGAEYSKKGKKIKDGKHFHYSQKGRNIVCIDDNFLPYGIINKDIRTDIKNKTISVILIPLYHKIIFEWNNAEKSVDFLLEDEYAGLKYAQKQQWLENCEETLVVRLFLTSSKTYKKHLFEYQLGLESSDILRRIPFPKLIWIAECREPDDNDPAKIICEIGIDATASPHEDSPHLYIRYPKGLIVSNRWDSLGRRPKQTEYLLSRWERKRSPFRGNLI